MGLELWTLVTAICMLLRWIFPSGRVLATASVDIFLLTSKAQQLWVPKVRLLKDGQGGNFYLRNRGDIQYLVEELNLARQRASPSAWQ